MKKKYGLIGYPLVHSFSKSFFNRKFESEHIDAEYINFEIADVRELKNVLRDNPDLCGLNVTLPYKTAVIPLLDDLTDNARSIGAVNVIKFRGRHFGRPRLEGITRTSPASRSPSNPSLDPRTARRSSSARAARRRPSSTASSSSASAPPTSRAPASLPA